MPQVEGAGENAGATAPEGETGEQAAEELTAPDATLSLAERKAKREAELARLSKNLSLSSERQAALAGRSAPSSAIDRLLTPICCAPRSA